MKNVLGYYDTEEELKLIEDEYTSNFSTHTNLTSVNIRRHYESPYKFSTFQLHKLEQLKELVYEGEVYDGELESLKLVFNLNLKDVYIDTIYLKKYLENNNTFRFKITSKDGKKWTIETENNGLVTVNSKEELLKVIDTFEL